MDNMGRPDRLDRRIIIMVAAGCAISLVTFGARSAFGVFTEPLSSFYDWPRGVFALALAWQNLIWGISQPLCGALGERFGVWRVLVVGGILYAAGLIMMPAVDAPIGLHLTAGLLVGLGMGGASYITVISVLGRDVPEAQRGWALGLCTAAGSLGQCLMVPMGQVFLDLYGWQIAVMLIGGLVALVPVMALGLRVECNEDRVAKVSDESLAQVLRRACVHPSYLMVTGGFFVCGFQLSFITVDLPSHLTDNGISATVAALAMSTIGIFNMVGAYGAGILSSRYSRKYLLSLIYTGRAVAIAVFILLPPTPVSTLVFAASMGLLWLSTVPLTSGLVALMFGSRHMATLFGLTFFSHQIGSFLGVWLGGVIFDATQSYGLAWWLSVGLSLLAAMLNLPISERPAWLRPVPAE